MYNSSGNFVITYLIIFFCGRVILGDRTLHPRAVPPGAFPPGHSPHGQLPSLTIPRRLLPPTGNSNPDTSPHEKYTWKQRCLVLREIYR